MKKIRHLDFHSKNKFFIFDIVFKKFFYFDPVQNFIKKINTINNFPAKKHPEIIFGFNIKDNKLNTFKLYAEINNKNIDDQIILQFLPKISDFKYYLQFLDVEREANLAFAIKVDREMKCKKYFHIKINKPLEKFLETKTYKEKPTKKFAISIEYEEDKVNENLYFYYFDKKDIQYFLDKYSIKEDIDNIEQIEVTEKNNIQKIIIIFKWGFNNFDFNEINKSSTVKKCIEYFKEKYKLDLMYYGKYTDETISLYWSISKFVFTSFEKEQFRSQYIFNKLNRHIDIRNLL